MKTIEYKCLKCNALLQLRIDSCDRCDKCQAKISLKDLFKNDYVFLHGWLEAKASASYFKTALELEQGEFVNGL